METSKIADISEQILFSLADLLKLERDLVIQVKEGVECYTEPAQEIYNRIYDTIANETSNEN